MSSKTKQILLIGGCAVMALFIAFLHPHLSFSGSNLSAQTQLNALNGRISQKVTETVSNPHTITKIYHQDQLIGVLNNVQEIDSMLSVIYQENYQETFPDSSLALGTDIYLTEESSFFVYEDIDAQIMEYLKENELFSIEVNRIEFSNGAVVYVKNMEDFEVAKRQYLLNFINAEALDLISVNQLPAALETYGERAIDVQVAEQATITQGYASLSDIKMNVQEIVYFLSYGYGTEMKSYTTVEYDTVEGVASKVGLSSQQLITINADILKSETQLLAVGTELNITFFNSPINVLVTKERISKEVVYADETIYIPDNTLREGIQEVLVKEENGSKNVFYNETYLNGELVTQEVVSEEITLSPIQEQIKYGTKIIPGIGSGKFRYPLDNAKITCHWYCYAGHRGLDVINTANKSGSVKAADRGTIDQVGYNSINGYYVWIDHNNGYRTYYGHMASPCYYSVGVNVDKGEVIGQIGQTGLATGRHVHFVIELNGNRSDPCNWLGC